MTGSQPTTPVLFYDGACGLCARSVRWVLRHEREPALRFAPLQGQTYAALPNVSKPTELDTMVLVDADGLHMRDEAGLRVMRLVGGPWTILASAARIIPSPLRASAYRFIAARRMKWFGAADACKLPDESQRERFLP